MRDQGLEDKVAEIDQAVKVKVKNWRELKIEAIGKTLITIVRNQADIIDLDQGQMKGTR